MLPNLLYQVRRDNHALPSCVLPSLVIPWHCRIQANLHLACPTTANNKFAIGTCYFQRGLSRPTTGASGTIVSAHNASLSNLTAAHHHNLSSLPVLPLRAHCRTSSLLTSKRLELAIGPCPPCIALVPAHVDAGLDGFRYCRIKPTFFKSPFRCTTCCPFPSRSTLSCVQSCTVLVD